MRYSLGTELVKLYIGPDRKEFVVHKTLLCKSSNFFAGAFEGSRFPEGREGVMYIPEKHEIVFMHYVEWLYRGSIRAGVVEENLDAYFHLYYLAEMLFLD